MNRVFLLAAIFLAACNNNQQSGGSPGNTDTLATEGGEVADSTLSGCYSMATEKDTASLQLQVKDGHASGTLSYNLYEKDRNDGSFEGEIQNGILRGWYLFRSEGLMSVREIAWKINGTALWPARGEVEIRNDSAFFKTPGGLQFDSSGAFVKVPCVI